MKLVGAQNRDARYCVWLEQGALNAVETAWAIIA